MNQVKFSLDFVSEDVTTAYLQDVTGDQSVDNTTGYGDGGVTFTNYERTELFIQVFGFVLKLPFADNIPLTLVYDGATIGIDPDSRIAVTLDVDGIYVYYVCAYRIATDLTIGTIAVDELYFDTTSQEVRKITVVNDFASYDVLTDSDDIIEFCTLGSILYNNTPFQTVKKWEDYLYKSYFGSTKLQNEYYKAAQYLDYMINVANVAFLNGKYLEAVTIYNAISDVNSVCSYIYN